MCRQVEQHCQILPIIELREPVLVLLSVPIRPLIQAGANPAQLIEVILADLHEVPGDRLYAARETK